MMFDLKKIIEYEIDRQDMKESQYHLHKDGREGGSNLYPCLYSLARKWAGLPAPKKTGLRLLHGAATVGKYDHIIIQNILNDYFAYNPIEDAVLGIEVYEPYEIIPGLRIESPIDVAMVSPPGLIEGKVFLNHTGTKGNSS